MPAAAVLVRPEAYPDQAAIRRVNMDVFGRLAEANLVDVLRRHRQIILSLVAEIEQEIVGHAILTQVMLMPSVPGLRMLGLGPVAVRPPVRRRGIGSALVRQAIGTAEAEGWQAVVVLGEPQYFSRFGFVPAQRFGLATEFRAPADSFLVLELGRGTLDGVRGVVRYQPEFSGF
jgi:putative acetyltransferase